MTLTLQHEVQSPNFIQVGTQLARFEGRRQLKSPFLWLAALASLGLVWMVVSNEPSTLDFRSVLIAGACLPLAATALFLGNGSVMRDRSTGAADTTSVLPATRDARMLGLAAAGWAPALVSVGVVAIGVVLSLTDDPAGSFHLTELAVGPLVVILGQAVGVALGRWVPHQMAAPTALVVMAALFVIQDFWPGERTIPAASPFLPWRQPYTDVVQAEPRLPGLHLFYLLGLVALAWAIASRRWRALLVAFLVVVGAGVGLSRIEVSGEGVVAAVQQWGEEQPRVCEGRRGVQYCVIEGYEPWINEWAAVTDRAQGVVPIELGVGEVRQTVNSPDEPNDTNPTTAHVGMRLGNTSQLALQILAPELGLPGTRGEAAAMNPDMPACMASIVPALVSGEARGVAFLVLTDLVVPGSVETGGGSDGTFQFAHVELSEDEAMLAFQILDRPASEILAVLHSRWDELIEPTTSSATLAGWFGFEEPDVIAESSYEGMNCVCIERGIRCSG